MSIQNKGMIVYLNISNWTARKFDPKITKEVEDNYHAINSGRYNKILIATEYLGNIQKIVSSARKYHYENTLPWFDNGGRLLPAANYFDYVSKMDGFRSLFEREVAKFIQMYPDYKAEARNRLNGMFSDDDYPDETTLKQKYGYIINISPVQDADDFRVSLNDEEVSAIRDSIRKQVEQSTKDAMKDLWNRLYDVVKHMLEKLSDPDSKFKNSLVGNIKELCDLLPKLNITEDENLEFAVAEVKAKLADLSPENLRHDENLRGQTAIEAKRILEKMSHYIPAA